MSLKFQMADLGLKGMNAAHRAVLKVSGGKRLTNIYGMPAVELHVIGHKSGLPRQNMLTAPIIDDSKIVLVASKGGDDRDPFWYVNLMANPDAEIRIVATGEIKKIHAHKATDEEKAEMWPTIVSVYKGYAGYQKKTTRDIPVVICDVVG